MLVLVTLTDDTRGVCAGQSLALFIEHKVQPRGIGRRWNYLHLKWVGHIHIGGSGLTVFKFHAVQPQVRLAGTYSLQNCSNYVAMALRLRSPAAFLPGLVVRRTKMLPIDDRYDNAVATAMIDLY